MPETRPSPTPTKRSVFFSRLGTTLLLWLFLSVGIILNLDWLYLLLVGSLGFIALIECLEMFTIRQDRGYYGWTILVSLAYLGAISYHCLSRAAPGRAYFAHLDVFFLSLLIIGLFTITLARPLEGQQTLTRILGSFFSFFYAIILLSFLTRILYLPPEHGIFYALYLIAVTKFTDMGAYVVGSLCGKHKMIPHISPGKTWEGLGGAFLGAYAASILVYLPFQEELGLLSVTHILILPAIIGLTAVVGDLAESVLKRCLAVKDSGKVLPGIGGALDLIDSLCFTAPVLYLYMNHVIGVAH